MNYIGLSVGENTESVDYPLHESAKRGNTNFMNECIVNRVSNAWVYNEQGKQCMGV